MTLKVPHIRTVGFRAACDRLQEQIEKAREASDTQAARRALNEAYFALHAATDQLNRAEEAARRETQGAFA